MNPHVPHDLLVDFVEGSVGEQLAVHIASHLDVCPACGTLAANLEPLAVAFASVDDPVPPAGLAAAILERADEPTRRPSIEITVGAGLLLAASLLVALTGDPLATLLQAGIIAQFAPTVASHIVSALSISGLSLGLAALVAVLGGSVAARIAWQEREAL